MDDTHCLALIVAHYRQSGYGDELAQKWAVEDLLFSRTDGLAEVYRREREWKKERGLYGVSEMELANAPKPGQRPCDATAVFGECCASCWNGSPVGAEPEHCPKHCLLGRTPAKGGPHPDGPMCEACGGSGVHTGQSDNMDVDRCSTCDGKGWRPPTYEEAHITSPSGMPK